MSDQICPYCLNPKATGECGCPRVITEGAGGRIAELEAEAVNLKDALRLRDKQVDAISSIITGLPTDGFRDEKRLVSATILDDNAKQIAELKAEVERLRESERERYEFTERAEECERALELLQESQAEVERLRADGERLDWMQKNPASSEPKAYWSHWFRSWVWRHMGLTHLTLRAAIDAARKEKE